MLRYLGSTLLLLAGAYTSPAPAQQALPAADCVRRVREARIAEQSGDLERALQLLNDAVERCPEEIVALQELLRIHQNQELPAARTAELRRRLLERIDDPQLPLSPGSITFLIRNGDDDTRTLEALLGRVRDRLASDSGDLELLKARASLELALGLDREARASLGAVIEIEPSFMYVSRAVHIDLELEDWDSALALVEPWIADERWGAAVHKVYLELLARMGDTERVMAGLRELRAARADDILSDGGYLWLQKRIAWSLYDAGETEFAEEIWRGLLEDDPDDLEATRVVANLFATEEERQQLSAKVDSRVDALEEPHQLIGQAVQYLATGDHRRAYDIFGRLTDVYGSKEDFWFNYGVAAIALEEWETAAHAFGWARKHNADRADTHFQLAKALRELGRCAQAIEAMTDGLALDPDRYGTYYYLARCYAELGDQGKAALAMEEYRRRKPG